MGRLPGKILFSLILYAAGFVTAVYLLVPSSVQASDQPQTGEIITPSQDVHTADSIDINSQEWIRNVRTGIDMCICFAEEYALRAADLIRSKMGQG